MEKKVIRVGSVGVGAIWGGVHEPGIAKSPDLTLVAICDIDEKKLEQIHSQLEIFFEERLERDRKSTRLNSSHSAKSRMPSSA